MPGSVRPDPQDLADRMAPVAYEYARRVRTDDPMVLWRELVFPYDGYQVAALVALLAAAVDPTLHPDVLWGWFRHRDVIAHPSPILWDEDELPIEAMDSGQIDWLITRLARDRFTDSEIAARVGLKPKAVAARRRRANVAAGLRRGDVRTARAGVG